MVDTLTHHDFAAVYGPDSVRASGHVVEAVATSQLSIYTIVFQVLTLVVLGVYCWMVYYFREQVVMAFKSVVNIKSEERPGSENKHMGDRFLVAAMALGCVVSAIFAAKFLSPGQSGLFFQIAPAGVAVVVFVVAMVQFGVLKLTGSLTFTEELIQTLIRAKRISIAAAVMAITPFVLLCTGENRLGDFVLSGIAVAVVVVVAVLFSVRAFRLFREQKISFLVWFLYLCAVEIFPVSLVVVLALKNV